MKSGILHADSAPQAEGEPPPDGTSEPLPGGQISSATQEAPHELGQPPDGTSEPRPGGRHCDREAVWITDAEVVRVSVVLLK